MTMGSSDAHGPARIPLYVAYHDTEWGVPEYDDRALYEKLILDGFQAGLSWITILRKRDNFRRAFDNFDPAKIARYNKRKTSMRLMQDAGIVRNRAKIDGTVLSARAWLEIMEKGPGFSKLLWEFRRRQAEDQSFPFEITGAGRDADLARHVEGAWRRAASNSSDRPSSTPSCRRSAWSTITWSRAIVTPPARQGKALIVLRKRRREHAPARRRARGSACCPGAGSICLIPPRSTSRSRTSRMALRASRAGTGKRRGRISSRSRSTRLLVEADRAAAGRHLDQRLALALSLHDAPEYVIGDMITPFKAVIGDTYKAVEKRLLTAIHLRFGLPPELPAEVRRVIKAADAGAAFLEATQLAGFSIEEALHFFGTRPTLPAAVEREHLTPWPADTAEERYLTQVRSVV